MIPSELAQGLEGRYRIERELGAGGMATVYLAEDLKHGRHVAIKVLHPDLGAALGGERFLAEIRTTAKLQHPHILPLLDSGEAGNGLLYYVMPYVRGETLRTRLVREQQLPISDAVRIAREVADALQHAHGQGIVHRDIKPENILLQNGHALVADLGIALAVQTAGGARMTQTGLSLGTPQYMSPEQAMGERAVDARSDVYALGAVTYEMLAGEAPFTGANIQAIVAKVLAERPVALHTLRETVPPAVERAVLRALAKLPADRFVSTAAFADAIDAAPEVTSGAQVIPVVSPTVKGNGRRRGALLIALLLTAAAGMVGWLLGRRETTRPVAGGPVQLSIDLPPGTHVLPEPMAMAVSPDGRAIAVVGIGRDNARRLYLRRLEQVGARLIPGSEGAASPTFSPDGRSLAFVAGEHVKKVALDGGAPQVLAQVGDAAGMAWGAAGMIFVSSDGRLGVVPEGGGLFRPLEGHSTPPGSSERFPVVLPDGRTILYTQWSGTTNGARVLRRTVDPGPASSIGLDSGVALGLLDGALVVGGAGVLSAVPVDSRVSHVTGPARQLLDDVSSWLSIPSAAASRGGTIVYQPGGGLSDLVTLNDAGDTTTVSDMRRDYIEPRLSPDGLRIAVTALAGGGQDIWIVDRATRIATRLTTDGRRNARAEWTPDGSRVLFRHLGTSITELWWQRWDGGSPHSPCTLRHTSTCGKGSCLRTGSGCSTERGRRARLTSGCAERRVIRHPYPLQARHGTRWRRASPRMDAGSRTPRRSRGAARCTFDVFPTTAPGTRYPVSAGGGGQPVWGPGGRSLYYLAANGGMILRAHLAPGVTFKITQRDTVVRDGFFIPPLNGHALYDVTLDGALLLIRRAEADRPPVAIVGWWDVVRAEMSR